MFDFLSQGWVGSLIGILGLTVGIVGLVLYMRSKIGARPLCQMRSIRLIGKEEQELPSEIRILHENNEVPRLTLTKVWLWNDGTETINRGQIVEDDPIMLSLEEGDQILTAHVAAFTRAVNKINVAIDPAYRNKCAISFDFLDPNDGGRIELLHTSKKRYPQIAGTIRGIPKGLRSLPSPRRDLLERSFTRVLLGRSYVYGIAFVIGLVSLILSLSPDAWLSSLWEAIKSPDSAEHSLVRARLAFLITGLLYTILPAMVFLSRRRRYPQSLDEFDTDTKAKQTKP